MTDTEITTGGRTLRCGCLSVGNPHIVVVADQELVDIDTLGPLLENHPMFPEKVNVNFAWPDDDEHIRVATWERGCGRTLACGTGTSASAALLYHIGLCGPKVTATIPGGELVIENTDDGIVMTGPAKFVYSGEIEL